MQRVFRRAGRVTLFPAEGEPVMGYGLIAPLQRDRAEIGGLRHLPRYGAANGSSTGSATPCWT